MSVIKKKKNIFLKQFIVVGTSEVKTLFAGMWLQTELEPRSGTPLCSQAVYLLQRKPNCFIDSALELRPNIGLEAPAFVVIKLFYFMLPPQPLYLCRDYL